MKPTKAYQLAWPLPFLLLLGCVFSGCLYGRKQQRGDRGDERERRFVLIDARRLPEAVVHRVGLGNLEVPKAADIDEMREALCGGLEDRVIFYQLVISRHWHYYWLCSQDEPVRAMTPQGDQMLRIWLLQVQRRTLGDLPRCARGSTNRIFSQQHASGVTARAYCDGVVILLFPDGGEKTFEAHRGPLSATARTQARDPRGPTNPEPARPTATTPPGAPACARDNTVAACREFGERAFWQGVGQACAKICPALFTKCRALAPGSDICHKLSEHCATLKGTCVR